MPIGIIANAFTQIWQDRDRILLMLRTRDRLLQWGYTARDMIKLFRHFNTDGDGTLSIVEFKKMMNEMQIGLNDERVVELFDSIDKDKSGGIDVKEFIQGLFPSAYHEIYGVKKLRSREEDDDGRRSSKGSLGKSSRLALKRSGSNLSIRSVCAGAAAAGQDMLLPFRRSANNRNPSRSQSITSKGSRADLIIHKASVHSKDRPALGADGRPSHSSSSGAAAEEVSRLTHQQAELMPGQAAIPEDSA
mmetsp:Transcript_106652/g.339603  ORF Transcript_106652/g.339603 Transcript_106652/m.339603 type:complete len:247 (+) Transcript_106652:2-742(+)